MDAQLRGSFTEIGQQWNQAVSRTQQAIQESSAAKSIQEAATKPCSVCEQRFLRTNIFPCTECKNGCCRDCFVRVFLYNPTGECSLSRPSKQVQVCQTCQSAVLGRVRAENIKERMKRAHSFLDGTIEPYKYSPESKLEQSFRLGSTLMDGIQQVAGFLPLGDIAKAINAGAYIVRYGPLVLLGNDVVMALQLLVTLSRRLAIPAAVASAPQDLFGGLYYMMGEHCGERGKAPELEHLEHIDQDGRVPEPSQELLLTLRRFVRVLYVATYTDPTPTDAQRLLSQVLPGSELVLAELSDSHQVPSYFLTCTKKDRKAYLVLPGTRNSSDVVTDVNAEGAELSGGLAHRGMVGSAQWLLEELGPILTLLYTKGYTVTVIGHSLGAAVAALFTVLLRPQIATLKAYCFGTPACVDEHLMVHLLDCVVSVVNRDDVVPRLNVQHVQALVESALCPGQKAKTKAWMEEDWTALKDVERIVELRRRGGTSAQLPLDSTESELEAKIARLCAAGVGREAAQRALEAEGGDLSRALLRATDEEETSKHAAVQPAASSSASAAEQTVPDPVPKPQKKLPWGANTTSSKWTFGGGTGGVWGEFERLGKDISKAMSNNQSNESNSESTPTRQKTLWNIEENGPPMPYFLIPGQIVHLYSSNGLSRASLAPCTHEALTRIHPTPNMLDDHRVKAYDEALRQACIRRPQTPKWESFEDRSVCACCQADFNWAYVLKSEPQRMLARQHCFSCGRVVCDGCSQNKRAHQDLGLLVPVRTCDSCFFSPEKDH